MSKTYCAGSGTKILKKDTYRGKHYKGHGSNEGYRTTCPVCKGDFSVGPSSGLLIKHQSSESHSAARDRVYGLIYPLGLTGETARPKTDIRGGYQDTWIMAYMDGLADGAHNMKMGAFKRWLKNNKLEKYIP